MARTPGLFFVTLISAIAVSGPTFSQQLPLFIDVPATDAARSQPLSPTVVRSRTVLLDRAVLPDTTARSGDRISLNFFPDAQFDFVVESLTARSADRYVLMGRLADDPFSSVSFAVNGEVTQGNVRSLEHGQYHLRYDADSQHRVEEIDPTRFPNCGTGPEHALPREVGPQPPLVLRGGPYTADVLVVYTPAARIAAGGVPAIEALIELSISETNDAYVNSLIDLSLELAGTFEVGYNESAGFSPALSSLASATDGIMDEVHVAREATGADLVSLFIDNGEFCGLAYLMTTLSPAFASSAFSVEWYSCAAGNLTFAHELGHNMGAAHDITQSPGGGLFSYSNGWHWGNSTQPGVNGNYRSIMAYAPGQRVKHFSNPNVVYAGEPTGHSTLADVARTFNMSAPVSSVWRLSAAWIAVVPVIGVDSFGEQGGPFSPTVLPFNLNNLDVTSASWVASSNQPWATLSSGSGTLASGASQTVNVTLGPGVNALGSGIHTATISFSDLTNAKTFQYAVKVTVAGQPSDTMQFWYPLDADPGWTRDGDWQHGVPLGGGFANGDPTSGHTGANVFGYNLAGDYPDNMLTQRLQMNALDCSNLEHVTLVFWRWLGIEASVYDQARIRVSNDGSTFHDVWVHSGPSMSESSWSKQTVDLSAYADGQSNVRIRWVMGETDSSVTYPGWNIDDIAIMGDPIVPIMLNDVWVNFAHVGVESGTAPQPYTSIDEGLTYLNPGGTLHVNAGNTGEIFIFDSPMTIVAHGGTVTIGQGSR